MFVVRKPPIAFGVYDAAARVLRGPDAALAGPAGAFLAVGLLATTADLAARLGGVRALAGRRLLGHDDLVDQRHVDRGAEDLVWKLHVLAGLAGRGDDADGDAHRASFVAVRSAVRAPQTATKEA